MKKKIGDLTINEAFELHKKHCCKYNCQKCPIKNCNNVICDLFLQISEGDLDQEIEVEEDEK